MDESKKVKDLYSYITPRDLSNFSIICKRIYGIDSDSYFSELSEENQDCLTKCIYTLIEYNKTS